MEGKHDHTKEKGKLDAEKEGAEANEFRSTLESDVVQEQGSHDAADATSGDDSLIQIKMLDYLESTEVTNTKNIERYEAKGPSEPETLFEDGTGTFASSNEVEALSRVKDSEEDLSIISNSTQTSKNNDDTDIADLIIDANHIVEEDISKKNFDLENIIDNANVIEEDNSSMGSIDHELEELRNAEQSLFNELNQIEEKKNYEKDEKDEEKKFYQKDEKDEEKKYYQKDEKDEEKKLYQKDEKDEEQKYYQKDEKDEEKQYYQKDEKDEKKEYYQKDGKVDAKKNYQKDEKCEEKHFQKDENDAFGYHKDDGRKRKISFCITGEEQTKGNAADDDAATPSRRRSSTANALSSRMPPLITSRTPVGAFARGEGAAESSAFTSATFQVEDLSEDIPPISSRSSFVSQRPRHSRVDLPRATLIEHSELSYRSEEISLRVQEIVDERINSQVLAKAVKMDEPKPERKFMGIRMKIVKRCVLFGVIVIVLLAVILSVTLTQRSNSEDTTQTTTLPPTTAESFRLETLIGFLTEQFGQQNDDDNLELFLDQSSPQYAAANWIANSDPATMFDMLDVVNFQNATEKAYLLERYLLVLLYFSTSSTLPGDDIDGEVVSSQNLWTESFHFLSNSSVCEWNNDHEDHGGVGRGGVVCNGDGFVSEILLGRNNLTGTLMSEIGAFESLESLALSENWLEGNLPSTMGNLFSLEELRLNGNSFSGVVPTELTTLPHLDVLFLHRNKFYDFDEDGFCQRSNLIDEFWADCTQPYFQHASATEENNRENNTCSCCSYCCEKNSIGACKMTRYKEFHNLLTPLTGDKALDDGTTPQVAAMNWLANHDGLKIIPRDVDITEFQTIKERYVLAVLYFAFDGPNWERELHYLNASDICTWHDGYYDHCGQNNRILNINLEDNNMVGTIPPEVGLLHETLESLNLANNDLYGTLPSEIGALTQLWTLNLEYNDFVGTLPNGLGQFTELSHLDASNNKLNGTIPSELQGLHRVISVRFDNNQFTGTIPSEVGGMTNLEIFYLDSNRLTGAIPSEFGYFRDLEELQLSFNSLNQTIPSELGLLRKLITLHLDANALEGSLPSELGTLTFLRNFRADDNDLSGRIPTNYGSMTNLEMFHTAMNRLTGPLPNEVGSMTALKHLEVDRNLLNGTIPTEVGNLSNLKFFRLYRNYFTGTLPSEVGHFTSLVQFEPDSNILVGTVPTEVGLMRDVERFYLSYNNFTGPLPSEMGMLTNMQLLIFRHTFISGTMPTEFGQLSTLKTLSFRHTDITGDVESVLCRPDHEWDGVYGDCVDEFECTCCINCCNNTLCCDRSGENCYSNEWIPLH